PLTTSQLKPSQLLVLVYPKTFTGERSSYSKVTKMSLVNIKASEAKNHKTNETITKIQAVEEYNIYQNPLPGTIWTRYRGEEVSCEWIMEIKEEGTSEEGQHFLPTAQITDQEDTQFTSIQKIPNEPQLEFILGKEFYLIYSNQ
ncbi:type II inositol-3,4-bisphosphate 4-phosphatase-like protein, partial [Cricetulus griseus]